jgi:hypothetical protein
MLKSLRFCKKRCSEKIGLKSVIGIPLIYNDETIGVLKIGTKKSNYLNNIFEYFSLKDLSALNSTEKNLKMT